MIYREDVKINNIVIPSEARDLWLIDRERSLASLGMTEKLRAFAVKTPYKPSVKTPKIFSRLTPSARAW
jgi:hypothetical protein